MGETIDFDKLERGEDPDFVLAEDEGPENFELIFRFSDWRTNADVPPNEPSPGH